MLHINQLSFWEKETYLNNIDYLIIGSGIVGLSTAIHLKQAEPKKKVVVLERGYLPTGASTKNAGFACLGSPSELLQDLNSEAGSRNPESGLEAVWLTYAKRHQGLSYLRDMLGDEAIVYREEGSYEIFRDTKRQNYRECLDCLDLLNERIEEITGVKENFKEDPSILESSGMKGFCGAISIKAEGMLHTGKLMQTLIAKAIGLGVIILNGIEVKGIQKATSTGEGKSMKYGNNRTRTSHMYAISTNYGSIPANKLAICTNGLAPQLLSLRDFRGEPQASIDVRPVRAQVVVTSPIKDLPFRGTFHFDEGYYYFRNVGDRVLFGGGRNQDFEAEETDELNTSNQIINHLSSILEEKILPNHAFTIDHHWAGTMGVGPYKSPIIEQLSENLYCAVRLGGMGVAIGTVVGKELAELIVKDGFKG